MRTRWLAAADGAGFGFLVLVAVGAVLVVAGKLQFPDLGSGASVSSVLSAIVMTGLACLGATVNIGGVALSTLPLGALAAIGLALAWGARRAAGSDDEVDLAGASSVGLRVGVVFGALCTVAALLFRISAEPTPIGTDAPSVALFATMWGCFFGIAGAAGARGVGDRLRAAARAVPERWSIALIGARGAGLTVAVMLALATAAALLWIVISLLRGGPAAPFGFAEATAALLYLVAFFPNVVIAVLTLGLGAPISVGARLTEGGRLVGEFHGYSVLDWAGGPTPGWVYLLWLIPLVAAVLGGIYLAQASPPPRATTTAAVAAALVAVAAYELAALSGARLGAGLVSQSGVAAIAPEAGPALLLALAWSLLGGSLGVWSARRVGIRVATGGSIVPR